MQRMLIAAVAAGALVTVGSAPALADRFKHVDHVVVIYEENHSFDNLYGGWEGVDGLGSADAAHTTQVGQTPARVPYTCLKQNDPSLTSPTPLAPTCTDTTTGTTFQSAFTNAPFTIDDYIPPTATTCPNGVPGGAPGGCTRDLVHRYYQEPYQLDGGRQDRYVTGSDAIGLTMGVFDTKALPVYDYLHGKHHPHYAIADRFFQSAFGGSFLNHQWLIAARTPTWPGAPNDRGVRLRRLRGEHDPAAVPALRAGHRCHAAAPAADRADDRRPVVGGRRRLGLVLGRMVERQRRRRWARLDQRERHDLHRSEHGDECGLPQLPEQALPVPPPAVQLLRVVRDGHRGAGAAPARRGGVPG